MAAVPRLALPATRHPAITQIPLVEPKVTRSLGLIRRHGRSLTPAAEALYALLAPRRPPRRRERT